MLPAETAPYIMFMEYATGDVVVFVRKEEQLWMCRHVLAAQLRDGGDGYMGCVQATEYAIGISSASMERGDRIQELYAGIAQGRFWIKSYKARGAQTAAKSSGLCGSIFYDESGENKWMRRSHRTVFIWEATAIHIKTHIRPHT